MRRYLLDTSILSAFLLGRPGAVSLVGPWIQNREAMERYADIRLQLRRGQLIGDVDTLVAATALQRDLTLVTTDSDSERVPELKTMVVATQQLRR